jgi:hypothetical protein
MEFLSIQQILNNIGPTQIIEPIEIHVLPPLELLYIEIPPPPIFNYQPTIPQEVAAPAQNAGRPQRPCSQRPGK